MGAADFLGDGFGEGGEFGDDFGVGVGEVGLFADFLVEIVESGGVAGGVGLGGATHGFVLGCDGEFPRSLADGLEVVAGKVVVHAARGVFGLAEEEGGDVAAVDDGLRGQGAAGECDRGG